MLCYVLANVALSCQYETLSLTNISKNGGPSYCVHTEFVCLSSGFFFHLFWFSFWPDSEPVSP